MIMWMRKANYFQIAKVQPGVADEGVSYRKAFSSQMCLDFVLVFNC